MKIRRIESHEVEQLQLIAKQTFAETFSEHNSEEDMKTYLETQFLPKKLANELANPHSEFYFAIRNLQPVGYLKLNLGAAQTEMHDENMLEIERIYVIKEFQGEKIGQKLFEKAIVVARDRKVDSVWLGVWEKNEKALRFYRKNGFVEFGQHAFLLGTDTQTDLMMKLEIANKQLTTHI